VCEVIKSLGRPTSGIALIVISIIGCSSVIETEMKDATSDDRAIVKEVAFVEFKSQLGNTIVHPQWSAEDNGDAFSLTSPDGQAVINVLTFTVEGTGTLRDFQDMMVSQVEGKWRDSDWTDVVIGGVNSKRRELISSDENANSMWRVYVLQSGECYHAVFLNASSLVMEANGGFYDEVVSSFKGISRAP
jgi:hypothetical protein